MNNGAIAPTIKMFRGHYNKEQFTRICVNSFYKTKTREIEIEWLRMIWI